MAALTKENLQRASKRVQANKGVPGLDIEQTTAHLRMAWPAIREQLLSGSYRSSLVRRVAIPKPEGGERERAWHPDGDGSSDPAGAAASAAAHS